MLSVAEAQARVLAGLTPLPPEDVPLAQACGRVLAADVSARLANPPCDVSAMDGYAVRHSARDSFAVVGEAQAGGSFGGTVGEGDAVRIFTGAPVPAGADSIIIQENVERRGEQIRLLEGNVIQPGKHIRRAGLDFRRGDILLKAGRRLRARDVALAAAMNCATLSCARRPRIALLSTGDELVLPGEVPGPNQIISSSPSGLAAEIESWGGIAISLGIARDTIEDIRARLSDASTFDVVITIGGASVGDYDLVQSALAPELSVDFWKIAMRPGKPLVFGTFRGVPFLGLPGNPVSAFVCSLLFLKPAIQRLTGCLEAPHQLVPATLTQPMAANDVRQDYCRATLAQDEDGRLIATPLPIQDSGMLRFLAAAGGLIVRPPHDPALAVGSTVRVLRLD
jgi:molybdopterin molybdotransferase